MIKIIDLGFIGQPEAIASFLIETSEGPVLVETGPHSTLPNLEAGLKKNGYELADVKHVFLTHIHLDHAGAAWYFAKLGANIYLHPMGQRHMADPSRLMESAKRIYKDEMDRLWGRMESISADKLIPTENGATITIGDTNFQAWHTPGHAIHHIAWQVGSTLFAGDVAGVKIRQYAVMPPCPPPDINIEDWQTSIQKIKTLDLSTIYLTHYGEITDIDNHLDELERILLDWSQWMKPFYEAKADPKKVTPLFQEYVAGQLKAGEIDELGLQQYEAANPSWMSVAGLMRYWRKKEEREAQKS